MKNNIENYLDAVREEIETRERRKTEFASLIVKKRSELDELQNLIDDALSEDNLEKVEQLTIRKAGLEAYVRTLEERKNLTMTPAQKKEYTQKGSELYRNMANDIKAADEKDFVKAKALIDELVNLTAPGAKRADLANSALNLWTTNLSTIDGASFVRVNSKLETLHKQCVSLQEILNK